MGNDLGKVVKAVPPAKAAATRQKIINRLPKTIPPEVILKNDELVRNIHKLGEIKSRSKENIKGLDITEDKLFADIEKGELENLIATDENIRETYSELAKDENAKEELFPFQPVQKPKPKVQFIDEVNSGKMADEPGTLTKDQFVQMFKLNNEDSTKYNSAYFAKLFDVPEHIINNIIDSCKIPEIVVDPNNKDKIYGI